MIVQKFSFKIDQFVSEREKEDLEKKAIELEKKLKQTEKKLLDSKKESESKDE